MFTRLGYPFTITFDNAKQLISNVLSDYCNEKGITWNNIIPYWPQANGEVERQNRSLLKRLKIGHHIHGNWKSELRNFLQMYYTTPHTVTGKTPTELMFGRTIRSKLPSIEDITYKYNNTDFRDRDKILKASGKSKEDDRRRARYRDIKTGDTVLMQNLRPGGKLKLTFNPEKYTVVQRDGPCVKIKNNESGIEYERNVAHLKKIPTDDINLDCSDEEFSGFGDIDLAAPSKTLKSIESKFRSQSNKCDDNPVGNEGNSNETALALQTIQTS